MRRTITQQLRPTCDCSMDPARPQLPTAATVVSRTANVLTHARCLFGATAVLYVLLLVQLRQQGPHLWSCRLAR
jgi:hypothetical protein